MSTNGTAAEFVCEPGEHHWISSHEPEAPIWVIWCSFCGRHDFEAMLTEHDRAVAEAVWDEGQTAGFAQNLMGDVTQNPYREVTE